MSAFDDIVDRAVGSDRTPSVPVRAYYGLDGWLTLSEGGEAYVAAGTTAADLGVEVE